MAYVCQLIEGTETAIVLYADAPGYGLLDQGLKLNDPEIKEIWGGYLETELVRSDEGKRLIPLKLDLQGSTDNNLIDRVNALEKRLRHARRFHIEQYGDEVFLEFKLDNATHTVRFPVISGYIDKTGLMSKCALGDSRITELPVLLVAQSYWEDDSTYSLENYVENPGFWRDNPAGAVPTAPGESWAEVNGVDVVSTFDEIHFEVMGRSLDMVISPDAVNDTGVQSDNITVVASTQYYFECRCYHTAGADDLTARVYDVSNAAVIAASVLTFDNQDDAWEKLGVAFTTPVGCVLVRIEILRLAANSTAGDKTYRVDAVYLDQRSDAPTGWCSGRTILNHMDNGADHLNTLCVTEIPGEVDAELKLNVTMVGIQTELYTARRVRNNVYNFIWQLLGTDAFTEFETGGAPCVPGNIGATCNDSDKTADATAPGGCRVDVNFAVTQTMALRCYWRVPTKLSDYDGKFALIVMAKATGTTDTINMETRAYQDVATSGYWDQDGIVKQQIPVPTVEDWALIDGWALYSFPIGTHDNDLWDSGNRWVIEVWAEHISGNGINDTLQIAGAYLVPVDDSYFIAGRNAIPASANSIWSIKDMDGDRGVFIYSAATNRYYSNLGGAGIYPALMPEDENWFYFILGGRGSSTARSEASIGDSATVSVDYRPRGIFLRGTNP